MKFTFHPHAEKELDETENYYNDISKELGYRFREEIEITIHAFGSSQIVVSPSREFIGSVD